MSSFVSITRHLHIVLVTGGTGLVGKAIEAVIAEDGGTEEVNDIYIYTTINIFNIYNIFKNILVVFCIIKRC